MAVITDDIIIIGRVSQRPEEPARDRGLGFAVNYTGGGQSPTKLPPHSAIATTGEIKSKLLVGVSIFPAKFISTSHNSKNKKKK
jgi:hypothetical protein